MARFESSWPLADGHVRGSAPADNRGERLPRGVRTHEGLRGWPELSRRKPIRSPRTGLLPRTRDERGNFRPDNAGGAERASRGEGRRAISCTWSARAFTVRPANSSDFPICKIAFPQKVLFAVR